jgi:tRNA U34 5-carboxymethylaminomethyl modifying GTPase MnmE/TrmE
MREYVFGRMVLLEAKEFLSLMKSILEKKDSAKKQIEEMISDIIEEIREYEIEMLDEPEDDIDYGSDYEDDEFATGEDEEDEIEKLIRQTSQKEQEVEGDYSKMSKRELQELIDAALDAGDFEILKKIQPFMKESLEWKIYESEIKKILK